MEEFMKHMTKAYLLAFVLLAVIGGGIGWVAYGVGRAKGYMEAVNELFDVVADNNKATNRMARACQKALDRCYEIEHPDSNYNNDNDNENTCVE